MKRELVAIAVSVFSLRIAPAAAQESGERPQPSDAGGVRVHDGVFLRIGWGAAHLYSRGRADPSPYTYGANAPLGSPLRTKTAFGIAADIEIGATALPGLVFGLSLTSHLFANPDVEAPSQPPADPNYSYYDSYQRGNRYVSPGVFALLYANPRGGFNTGISVGLMGEVAELPQPNGFAVALHIGYDHWVGEQWSLGFFVRPTFARLTSSDGTTQAVENVTLTAIGVAVTHH
jgi:hypothetical protein